MNERLRQRIENFAGADRGIQLMPDTGINSGMQLMPDIRRDGLVTARERAMQLLEQIEALGGNVSEGERRLFMNMSPEELNNTSMGFTRGIVDDTKGAISDREMELFERMSPKKYGPKGPASNISDREMDLYERLNLGQISSEDYLGAMELSRKLDRELRMRKAPEPTIRGTTEDKMRAIKMYDLMDALSQNKGSLSDREAQSLIENFDVDIDGRDYQFEGEGGLDLMGLRQRLGLEPMYDATGTEFDEVMVMPEAEALSQMGRGPDTELAHLEPGDVVIPPAVLENDPMLADVLEERMAMAGVDPRSRVAGLGIASLNPNTGLEEFGFFKSLKKVVKKVAPYAGIIAAPFTGGLSAALIGGAGGLLSGKGLKGAAMGALGGFGASAALGKLGLTASAIKGAGGLAPALKGAGAKIAGGFKGLGSLGKTGGLLSSLGGGGGGLGGLMGTGQGAGMMTGGTGGIGLGGLLGAGVPAALLAKKAYDEAKKDYGVPMTPLTQFDSMGRYNIEAEIARRMGKEQPNPVEFGLLPELPELSGGAPIEQPVQKAAYGGPVMAFADGGDVALEDFERMSGDINGAGTETSDDIPAMLSDGEFVMTGKSVRGAGAFEMTKGEGGIITLVPSLEEDKQRGTDLMYQMMNEFSNYAQPI